MPRRAPAQRPGGTKNGPGIVSGHAFAAGIHVSQVVLCDGMTLFGGRPEPACGLDMILRHLLSLRVHIAEMVLCGGMPLPGSFTQPVDGVAGILVHPVAPCIFVSQVVLRRRMSLLQQPGGTSVHGLGVIFGDVSWPWSYLLPRRNCALASPRSPALYQFLQFACARSTGQANRIKPAGTDLNM